MSLRIPDHIRVDIIDHARGHAPRECCGVIAGANGELTTLHRLNNTEQNNIRYQFDDEEFFRVYWDIENSGEELMVVYHSHPETVAYPSATDVARAEWPQAVYVICSLEHADEPVIRGFRILDGEITEVELT